MGIAGQSEAEMADVVGREYSAWLWLRSMISLISWRLRRAGHALQQPVEIARMELIAWRQGQVQPMQDGAQRLELIVRGRGVDAIHAGALHPLQLLCGSHVGQDHELLDQPVAVEPLPRANVFHLAVAQDHLPLRQVEIERAPRLPGREQGAVGREERRRVDPPAPARRSGGRRCA